MLYIKLSTGSFNLVRYFIERMMTLLWLLKAPPCLRSSDWEFRVEAILIQARLDISAESAKL